MVYNVVTGYSEMGVGWNLSETLYRKGNSILTPMNGPVFEISR